MIGIQVLLRIATGVLLLGLQACQTSPEKPVVSSGETRTRLFQELGTSFETKNITAPGNQEIRFPSGVQTFWLGNNVVDLEGRSVEGPFNLKVRPFIRPSDFIRNGAHTMGPGGILNTGGQMELRIEKNGVDLTGKIRFKSALTFFLPADYPLARMQNLPAWEGELLSLASVDQIWYWKPGQEMVPQKANLISSNRYFQTFPLLKPGLVLLGQTYSAQGEKVVKPEIQAPPGADLQNSICYAWFPNLNSIVRLQAFDRQRRVFHTGGYQIPESARVVYILVNFDGKQWKYQEIKTFAGSALVSFPGLDILTLDDIITRLKAL